MSEESNQNNMPIKRSRKKRKNFLLNAKKYVKKGQRGRGTQLPEELYQYFVEILDNMKQGIEDSEQRQALVNNVMEQTKEHEFDVLGNQLGSRLIEILLPFTLPEDLERYAELVIPELRRLCPDNFSSHVIEALLRVSSERAIEHLQKNTKVEKQEEEEEGEPVKKKRKMTIKCEPKFNEDHVSKCHDYTMRICKFIFNNLEDFAWDPYANHILRSAMKCLSGITLLPGEKAKTNLFKETLPDNKGIPPHENNIDYKNVPVDYKQLVKEFATQLSSWPQFKDMPYKNLTSGLLQVLLYAINNVDKNLTKSILKKLLDESFAPDDWVPSSDDNKDQKDEKPLEDNKTQEMSNCSLPPVFDSESAVRLLEAALFVSSKKTYTQIYAKCFINRLGQLVTMPMLNFTVQRLIDNCHVKEEFEHVFDELSDKFNAILSSGNTGVLVALARACHRLHGKQMQFINKLEEAFNCSKEDKQKYFSVCCLRLLPVDRIDLNSLEKEYFINVHGSVILQTILDYQRPAKAVQGLLELTTDQLLVILLDGKGCHVADGFCKGQCVGVKARDKLIWKLKGYYQTLALSKFGSRALEQIFEAASLEQKVKIMTELSDKSNLLNSTNFGRIIATKLDVNTFKTSQKKWEQIWSKRNVNKA